MSNFQPWSWRVLALPAALLALAAAALAIDLPLARWWLDSGDAGCPGWLRSAVGTWLTHCESFGHGVGVVLILAVMHQLDPGRRRALLRIGACTLAAGLAANLLKLLVLRVRPAIYVGRSDFPDSVWETFQQWFPHFGAGFGGQSFPSAHTATAVGLAAALSWAYPRGRGAFTLLAVFVGLQRIQSGAHFPSDVLCGAAVAALVAPCFLRCGHLPPCFDRWEAAGQPPDLHGRES